MSGFFALLADCLQALANELDLDLASVHEIESYPNAFNDGWFMHINNERFAEVKMFRGKPDVRFSAYYSDFDYLFRPEEAQA